MENYEIIEPISSGSFAQVYKAIEKKTQQVVAIKVFDKTDSVVTESFHRELDIFMKLDHPLIVHFFEWFEFNSRICLVMEYVPGGTLLEYVNDRGTLSEDQAKTFLAQLADVLSYLHNEVKIIHRDLKAENILIDRWGNIRVIDFGLSKVFENNETMKQTICGSLVYTAPEMVAGLPYNMEVDIWALGVIFYAMLFGRLPFKAESYVKQVSELQVIEVPFPKQISLIAGSLINAMMRKNPNERITAAEILKERYLSKVKLHREKVCDVDREVLSEMKNLGVAGLKSPCEPTHEAAVYKILHTTKIVDRCLRGDHEMVREAQTARAARGGGILSRSLFNAIGAKAATSLTDVAPEILVRPRVRKLVHVRQNRGTVSMMQQSQNVALPRLGLPSDITRIRVFSEDVRKSLNIVPAMQNDTSLSNLCHL